MVFTILGILLSIFYLGMIFKFFNRFDYLKEKLDEVEYKHEYFDYCILGMAILFVFKIPYNKYRDRIIKTCEIIYGKNSGKLVNYYLYAQQVTIIAIGLVLFLLLYVVIDIMSLFILVLCCLVSYLVVYELKTQKEQKDFFISMEFPSMISKFTLLLNAGCTVKETWDTVCNNGSGIIYREMKVALDEMRNGINENQAIQKFSSNIDVPEIKKFSSLLLQTAKKGNSDLVFSLRQLVEESLNEKSVKIKTKAQNASQKLLLPSGLIFFGIMIIIIAPLFISNIL